MRPERAATSEDAVLGGKLVLRQPRGGDEIAAGPPQSISVNLRKQHEKLALTHDRLEAIYEPILNQPRAMERKL